MRKQALLLIITLLFQSLCCGCAPKTEDLGYEAVYPELYTPEYCYENYVEADPGLIHLCSAKNSLDRFEIPGGYGYGYYYAIKDVPMEDYLALKVIQAFVSPFNHSIVRNKNADMPVQEILSYKLKGIDLYTRASVDDKDWSSLGKEYIGECVASLDSSSATSFQAHIIDCIENGNYTDSQRSDNFDLVLYENKSLHMMAYFEEYENLAWSGLIIKIEGQYYLYFFYRTADIYKNIYLPLSDEIVSAIPK